MTVAQIIALIVLGPPALIFFAQFIHALMGKRDFHIIQALVLFVCIVIILLTFIGVE